MFTRLRAFGERGRANDLGVSSALCNMSDGWSEIKIASAAERLRAIWPLRVPMTDTNVVIRVSMHHPFRSPNTKARFLAAVRSILASS